MIHVAATRVDLPDALPALGRGVSGSARKLLTVADAHRVKFASIVYRWLADLQEGVDETALEMLLRSGDKSTVQDLVLKPRAAADGDDFDVFNTGSWQLPTDAPTAAITNASIDIASAGAGATQCDLGGPIPKAVAKAKKAELTDDQLAAIYQKYKAGVKKAQIQAEFGLTGSQLQTAIYKQEVNLFPVEKLQAIWQQSKLGLSEAQLQKMFDLTQSQIAMSLKKMKSGVPNIKAKILAPPTPVEKKLTVLDQLKKVDNPPSLTKPGSVPWSYTSDKVIDIGSVPKPLNAKTATWDPLHPTKKPFEQFWLEKKQYHGFTDEEIAWNLQIPQSKLTGLFEVGKVQQANYVSPGVVKATPKPSSVYVDPKVQGPETTLGKASTGGWPIGPDVVRSKGSKYQSKINEAYEQWHNALTQAEQRAIASYTGSGYSSMNSALRAGGALDGSAAAVQKGLLKAARYVTPPPPELVWRGLSNSGSQDFVSKLAAGDVIELKGFQSTSINPYKAHDWASGNVVFEIKPKAGAWVKPLSLHSAEDEFLLPHGAKYRVRGQETIKIEGGYKYGSSTSIITRRVIQLEML